MKSGKPQIFAYILGPAEKFDLDHRIFNAVCVFVMSGSILGGMINLWIARLLIMAILPFALSAIFGIFYLFSRFEQTPGSYHTVYRPALFFLLFSIACMWFFGGGSYRALPYYLLLSCLASVYLFHGKLRLLIAILYMLVSMLLIAMEYYHPNWLQPFDYLGLQNRQSRYLVIATHLLLSLLLLSLLITAISRNYHEMVAKIQNYRVLFFNDLELARDLQERILHYDPKIFGELDCKIVYKPSAELSGDLYDISRPEPGRLRIFIADAMGHGINSALSAMLIKSEWMNVNRQQLSPAQALAELNRRISSAYSYFSIFPVALFDIENEKITYASAGHPLSFLRSGEEIELLKPTGPLLCVDEKAVYGEREVPFPPLARLLIFTDGLTEAADARGNLLGTEWLYERFLIPCKDAADLCDALFRDLDRRTGRGDGPASYRDDLTFIAIFSPFSV